MRFVLNLHRRDKERVLITLFLTIDHQINLICTFWTRSACCCLTLELPNSTIMANLGFRALQRISKVCFSSAKSGLSLTFFGRNFHCSASLNTSFEGLIKSFRFWYAHRYYWTCFGFEGSHRVLLWFSPFSDDGDAGLKARIRRGNGQEGHKLAYQTWVAFFWGFCLMQSSLRLGISLIRWIKWLPRRCTRSRLWVHGFLKSKVMPKFSYSKNIRVQFFITGDKPRYFRI